MEKLVKLSLPPGIFKNGTPYQGTGRWIDSHLVRWVDGALRSVGGWIAQTDTAGALIQTAAKPPRTSLAWRKNDSSPWMGVGTPTSLYAFSGTGLTLTDITPAGLVTGQQDGSLLGGGVGYGLGSYGLSSYGGLGGASIVDADTWSLDTFGEVLLACLTSDGKIYESTPTAQATQVTNSPTNCRSVCVTPERFVFALGASGDPRLVKWSTQSDRTVWTPSASNSAGSFPLQTSGRLVAGRRTQRETLLWTDTDLWGAQYVGGQLIYAFTQRGSNCGLLGPNAIAQAEGAAYWMGQGEFFRYDGAVKVIPCEVSDHVFSNLAATQKAKIAALPVAQFGEVWWFYPSATQSGLENDRYVMYNYRLGTWAIGYLGRAAGAGAGTFAQPMLWDSNGYLYAHELGQDRHGEVAFVETGPLELGDGDRIVRVQSILPDETTLGDVTVQFFASFQPEGPETSFGPYFLTPKTDVRATGRQLRARFVESGISAGPTIDSIQIHVDASVTIDSLPGGGVDWRIGNFRAGILAEGYR